MMAEQNKNKKEKRLIMLISTVFFLIAFILNISSNQALFNYNLKVVPDLQNHPFFGSEPFIVFMNLCSNLFNPIICAGYILVFYVISHRKLEILVFLVWFIFLSVALSFAKELIHQARPYWMEGSGVQMLEWTCYTQYGCPSGHSMLGLILIEFIIRFYARAHENISKKILIFYLIGLIVQGLVVFSRVILGMHSLNQVTFGLLLGFYSFIPYYLFVQQYILKLFILLTKRFYRVFSVFIISMCILFFMSIELILTYAIDYYNEEYWRTITKNESCSTAKLYSSFQYKCFQDLALVMSAFGIMIAIVFNKNPENLMKVPEYQRNTILFLKKVLLMIVISLIPLAIFLNPFWKQISLNTEDLSLLLWLNHCFGLFFGIFFLVFSPYFAEKFSLQKYSRVIAISSRRQKSRYFIYRETEEMQRRISDNNSLEIPK